MDPLTLALFVAGLIMLISGAELLVRGASRLAFGFGISPLVVGLTVVAFGTSAPELVVTILAGLSGAPDIALGNVVGSNIANILLILGISAIITPLIVSHKLVRREAPLMLGVAVLPLALGLDGAIGRLEGWLLVVGLITYTMFAVHESRQESAAAQDVRAPGPEKGGRPSIWRIAADIGLVIVGLLLLVLGARWLVGSAVNIARTFGLSELIIGLTIIAVGTSLPEAATSIVASLRGERDIAVGNIVGSNIFNILSVLGLTAAVAPHGVAVSPAALRFDIPFMIAVTAACLPVFFTGHRIARWEGVLFLAYYVIYASYLILDAMGHDALPAYSTALFGLVTPLVAATLAVLAFRAWRASRLA